MYNKICRHRSIPENETYTADDSFKNKHGKEELYEEKNINIWFGNYDAFWKHYNGECGCLQNISYRGA